jgi:hypothetical protein
LFCWFRTAERGDNPKKLSTFVEDVMDPYGRQDKYLSELKEVDDKMRVDKLNKDAAFSKKVLTELQQTTQLLKNNITCAEQIYSMIEEGRGAPSGQERGTITLKKNNIVRLFGSDIQNPDNIKILFDETATSMRNPDNAETRSIRSDSSNSLIDLDVIGKN